MRCLFGQNRLAGVGATVFMIAAMASNLAAQSAPSGVSISPSSGSGSAQTFSYVFSDPAGATNIQSAMMDVSATLSGPNACYLYFANGQNLIYLADDSGTFQGSLTIGNSGTQQNSQCIIDAGASSVSRSGNLLTVNLALSFTSAFAGAKNNYMTVYNGLSAPWQQFGTWTATVSSAPSAVSVTPSSGSGSSQIFSFVFSDSSGYAHIQSMQVDINATLTAASACYMYIGAGGGGVIYLANDAGNGWLPSVPAGGSTNTENSQCLINAAASSLVGSGNTLTLNLAFVFKSAFAGAKNTYMEVYNGLDSNWVQRGTWTATIPTGPLTITTNSLPNGAVGVPYSQTLSGTGGTTPYHWLAQFPPPSWLTLSSGGVLSGTPTVGPVTFPVFVQLVDNIGANVTKTLNLTIATGGNPLASSCSGSPNPAITGQTVTFSALASGGTSPYTYSWSGAVSGTAQTASFQPGTAGNYTANLTVHDASSGTSNTSCSVNVQAPPTITTTSPLTGGTVSTAYSATFTATGGTTPYTWSVISGSLPTGLNLSGGGALTGTPSVAGMYNFTVRVTDNNNLNSSGPFSLTIGGNGGSTVTVTTASPLTSGTVNTAYTANFTATGGTPGYTWLVTAGTLPPGLNLSSSGVLSGTPTTVNAYSFTVQATDTASHQGTKVINVTINSAVTQTMKEYIRIGGRVVAVENQ